MTELTFDPADGLPAMTDGRMPLQSEAPIVGSATSVGRTYEPPGSRDIVRIPRIVIQAFCESPVIAEAIERAAQDRLMSRASVRVHMGGPPAAVEYFRQTSTPDLVIVESRAPNGIFLAELDRLSEVCYSGTRVMAIGAVNDITFYRELMKRGISEYILAPVDPIALISCIAGVYGETASGKLGQVYAFIGAKGGVGSSTIAHNVAWTLARRLSSNVVLADMDLPFGTASLDFNLDAGQGIAEAIQDISRLDEVLLDRLLTKCNDHLSLLSAPALLERSYDLNEGAIEQLIEVAQSSVPFMILDMPHIWTSWVRKVLVSADQIVITATPDLANLRNAKNLVGVLQQARPHDPPPKLVLNQVGIPKRPEIKPAEFCKALQLDPVAIVPFDAALFGAASNKGQMIGEASAKGVAAKAFAEIMDVITGRHESKRGRSSGLSLGSLFGKTKRKANAPSARA